MTSKQNRRGFLKTIGASGVAIATFPLIKYCDNSVKSNDDSVNLIEILNKDSKSIVKTFTIQEPVERDQNRESLYEVPVSTLKMNYNKTYGTLVKLIEVDGDARFCCVVVKIHRIDNEFAKISFNNLISQQRIIESGDILIDDMTSYLQSYNRQDHKKLKAKIYNLKRGQ